MKLRSLSLASFGIALFVAMPASATPNFPGAIQRDLQLNYTPPCTTCHNNPAGGTGTVTQPFGIKMRARGLVPEDEASLQLALTALDAEKSDVDGDGVPDIQELRLGTDPNGVGESQETPSYGCGSSVTPPRALLDAPVILSGTLMAIGAIFLRRRRASRTSDEE